QELWVAWIGDVVQLKTALADTWSCVVAAVLQTDRQDVAISDLDRVHVLHRGVGVVAGIAKLERCCRIRNVDDIDTRPWAGASPATQEREVLVARDVSEHTLVERVALERADQGDVASFALGAGRRRLIAEVGRHRGDARTIEPEPRILPGRI